MLFSPCQIACEWRVERNDNVTCGKTSNVVCATLIAVDPKNKIEKLFDFFVLCLNFCLFVSSCRKLDKVHQRQQVDTFETNQLSHGLMFFFKKKLN